MVGLESAILEANFIQEAFEQEFEMGARGSISIYTVRWNVRAYFKVGHILHIPDASRALSNG
jgi:hypothetical protein